MTETVVDETGFRLGFLRDKVRTCNHCGICREALYKPTSSSGVASKVMFVGRNPGIQERDAGLPFIGKTKAMMDDMLSTLGYSRESAYITNVVKCYTSIPKPDRPPTVFEVNFCAGLHLEQELSLVKPKLVVPLGKDAWLYFVRDDPTIKSCTGYTGRSFKNNRYPFVIFPMFHPGSLLRDPIRYREQMEQDFGNLFLYCRENQLLAPGAAK